MAAGDLFKRAAAYRKKHPGMTMPEAVKACSKGGKKVSGNSSKGPASVRRAHADYAREKRRIALEKKKAAAVGRKPRAAPKKAAPRKIKIKAKGGTRVTIGKVKKKSVVKQVEKALGIGGVAHTKIGQEHAHQRSLIAALDKHRAQLKVKGQTPAEKTRITREIDHYRSSIAASKKHVNALKRSL